MRSRRAAPRPRPAPWASRARERITPLPPLPSPLLPDFARKAKVPLAGLDAAGITAKLDQAVAIGEQMPRAPAHSLTHGHELPLIID